MEKEKRRERIKSHVSMRERVVFHKLSKNKCTNIIFLWKKLVAKMCLNFP